MGGEDQPVVLILACASCALSWPKVYTDSVLSFNPVLVCKVKSFGVGGN